MAYSSPECLDDDDTGFYWETAISIPLLLIFHVLLLAHTIHRERNGRHDSKFRKATTQRSLYIALQCLAIYWLMNDLLRYVIDPYTKFIRNSPLCAICAYSPKIISAEFYAIYLFVVCPSFTVCYLV